MVKSKKFSTVVNTEHDIENRRTRGENETVESWYGDYTTMNKTGVRRMPFSE